jgi:hypothetical protein
MKKNKHKADLRAQKDEQIHPPDTKIFKVYLWKKKQIYSGQIWLTELVDDFIQN